MEDSRFLDSFHAAKTAALLAKYRCADGLRRLAEHMTADPTLVLTLDNFERVSTVARLRRSVGDAAGADRTAAFAGKLRRFSPLSRAEELRDEGSERRHWVMFTETRLENQAVFTRLTRNDHEPREAAGREPVPQLGGPTERHFDLLARCRGAGSGSPVSATPRRSGPEQ